MSPDEILKKAEDELESASLAAESISNVIDRVSARVKIAYAYMDLVRLVDKQHYVM